MERVLDVAQYIFDEYKKRSGTSVDEMKLHKLLYLTQRETYALTNAPMFNEPFYGWKYGPVCKIVRSNFTADGILNSNDHISKESAYIVNNIIEQYGFIESWALSRLTHRETSWQKSRVGLSFQENGDREIPLEDIAEDAKKIRPYDAIWDMYYDEFEDWDGEKNDI